MEEWKENRITILDKPSDRKLVAAATRNRDGRVCQHQELLSPLLNYYLASLYQVRRGGNATVARAAGALLLYILLPDVDSADLHKETYAVVTLVD
ncbi:hypothetical protein X777_07071 [Ooceraea biroi]|uniref:Uncharacterized protein n=1 Tax=Ooceraea biroi TaxID=2015173 RepID=A0A026W9H0_OOCBI|nr:hypothetical protein X777_07071 [Ooceraea biroi]